MNLIQMQNNLENKLKELKQAYLKKLEDILLNFKKNLEDTSSVDIAELYSQVHKISGTSGMYGLKKLSEISSKFEMFLKEEKNNKPQKLKNKLFEYIKIIEETILEGS